MEITTNLNPADFIIDIDFRLLELSTDLSTLEKHFELIEGEIERGKEAAEREMHDKWHQLKFKDEAEWSLLGQDKYFQEEFVLPRVFRNPFLITLFTVYETAVVEVANRIQKRLRIQLSLDDLRGDLPSRAKKYYGNVLHFELTISNSHWQRIKLLCDLRNAIAHANGRVDMMRSGVKKNVLKIDGVSEMFGYIIVDEVFLRDTFALVKEELEGLVARYKEWDTEYCKSNPK